MKTAEEWMETVHARSSRLKIIESYRLAMREAAQVMRTRCAEALQSAKGPKDEIYDRTTGDCCYVREPLSHDAAAALILAVPLPGDPTS